MHYPVEVSHVRFVAGPPSELDGGLLGFATFRVNGILELDGVAVRRTLDGRLVLSFPARRDGSGRHHSLVKPLNDAARADIERQVLEALGLSRVAQSR